MPKRPGFATVTDPENNQPIRLRPLGGGVTSLARAKALHAALGEAIGIIEKHFHCPFQWEWPTGKMLAAGSKPTVFTCYSRGSVKIGDRWYCKTHAKQLTPQPPKPSKAELRAARKIAAADAKRTLLAAPTGGPR
jgi:hypothetical protein